MQYFHILQYFLQYLKKIAILFAILENVCNTFCNTWKICNKYCNTLIFCNTYCNTLWCCNTKVLQYFAIVLQYNTIGTTPAPLPSLFSLLFCLSFFFQQERGEIGLPQPLPWRWWLVNRNMKGLNVKAFVTSYFHLLSFIAHWVTTSLSQTFY